MKEVKGHIYHRQRKWKCPNCNKVKMQQQKETNRLLTPPRAESLPIMLHIVPLSSAAVYLEGWSPLLVTRACYRQLSFARSTKALSDKRLAAKRGAVSAS